MMSTPEPATKRATAFVDGQNLFHAVKEAFGYTYPNYDVKALAERACSQNGWQLKETRFYTGVPCRQENPSWGRFWEKKLLLMSRSGIHTFSREIRYRNQTVVLPNGKEQTVTVGREKGVDIRIALDVVRLARESKYDVAIIFSQDQDFSEVADEIRAIARQQERWVKIASAFPVSPTRRDNRGINKTDWIPIDREAYEACIDSRDYRPKTK